MSDAAPVPATPPEDAGELQTVPKPGLFADPVVRVMVYASICLLIVFLAAVIGVLATGVASHSSPRSLAEKDLMLATARLTPESKGDAWAPYINALIAAGDRTGARLALKQARASATGTMPVSALDLAEARLARQAGDNTGAAAFADKAMKGYKAEYEALIARGGKIATSAKRVGYGADYYNAALVKAWSLAAMKRWKEAVATFDIYLNIHGSASDILIDRGNAKANLNDKAGAEKDFREALRFVPYDEEAKAGLKRIGVAQ